MVADAPSEGEAVPQGERTGSSGFHEVGECEADGDMQGAIKSCLPREKVCNEEEGDGKHGVDFLPSSLRMDGERRRHQQGDGCRDVVEWPSLCFSRKWVPPHCGVGTWGASVCAGSRPGSPGDGSHWSDW